MKEEKKPTRPADPTHKKPVHTDKPGQGKPAAKPAPSKPATGPSKPR